MKKFGSIVNVKLRKFRWTSIFLSGKLRIVLGPDSTTSSWIYTSFLVNLKLRKPRMKQRENNRGLYCEDFHQGRERWIESLGGPNLSFNILSEVKVTWSCWIPFNNQQNQVTILNFCFSKNRLQNPFNELPWLGQVLDYQKWSWELLTQNYTS